jgi:outer membrane protein assembly factor BamB
VGNKNEKENEMIRKLLPVISLLLLPLSNAAVADSPNSVDAIDSPSSVLQQSGVQGGLVVHVGGGNGNMGQLLAEYSTNDGYLVHGLSTDPAQVAVAREYLLDQGLYGKISVALFDGKTLPYAENLVNLVVVVDDPDVEISREELLRVLVPNGIALIDADVTLQGDAASNVRTFINGGVGIKTFDAEQIIKPIPSDIDEWSHFEHGPGNNPVAADTVVGPPRHLQWAAGPRWLRSHEVPSGISCMVTAGGRFFHTLDEGPIGISDARLPEQWSLIARDAFNGTQLWKIPIPHWGWQTFAADYRDTFKDGGWIYSSGLRGRWPSNYKTRMVADSERLYFTLGNTAPVSIIDAATGEVITTCTGSDNPNKLILCNDVLCVELPQAIIAYDARSGSQLWKKDLSSIKSIAASGNSFLYVAENKQLHSCDLKTGEAIWDCELEVPGKLKIAYLDPDTTLHGDIDIKNGLVLSSSGSDMQVLSLDTGETVWSKPDGVGVRGSGSGQYIVGDTIWLGYRGARVDLKTGEALPALGVENLWSPQHHHRCYPNKATSRYIIGAMEGMEFLALEDESHSRNNWLRGSCGLGILPANGMTYVPVDQCFCSAGVKLLGTNVLTAAREFPEEKPTAQRLTRGEHYDQADAGSTEIPQWPSYRHDALRSGSNAVNVSANLRNSWRLQLDPSITQPVVSGDRLFLASRDTHTVYAVDTVSGEQQWRYTADGRVDSSPTLYKGLLLFGSADGYVTCLRQSDGELVWKFRAAPHERLIQSFGQLESVWPLHGSVLILDDLAYVSAGRSTYLDGGLFLYAIEPTTGRVVYRHQEIGPYEDHAEGVGHSYWSEGARNDVLVSDGESIYIMQLRFDRQLNPNPAKTESLLGDRKLGRHIFSTAGFLDGEGYNRTFWMHSNIWPGFNLANQASKSGQLLVFNDDTTFGIKTFWTRNRHSPMFFPATEGYLLFADDIDSEPILVGRDEGTPLTWLPEFNMNKGGTDKANWGPELQSAPRRSSVDAYTYNKDKGIGYTRVHEPKWAVHLPIRVNAMVAAEEILFVAGAPDVLDEDDPLGALEGRKGGLLRAVSVSDGSMLAEYSLDSPPLLDGLIAVEGKLFLVTADGQLTCWE